VTVADPGEAVVLRADPVGMLAGHVATGAGPAQVAVLRTGGLGLLVACTAAGPVARAGLAGAALARAAGVEEAVSLISAAASGLDGSDRVWLADPGEAVLLEVGPHGARRLTPPPPPDTPADLAAVRELLRRADGSARAVSAIAAHLDPAGPTLLVCLGPLAGGVFVRQWPGLPPPPPLTAAADRPPLVGSLAAMLARRPGAAGALAAAEAEALAEGEEGARLARIMDAAGDDHGAEVRRALAQAHAVAIAVAALEGPIATSGASGGPTL
jgi:hypothetical protein